MGQQVANDALEELLVEQVVFAIIKIPAVSSFCMGFSHQSMEKQIKQKFHWVQIDGLIYDT